jgi:succinoglycan biosynthesis protein ExoA
MTVEQCKISVLIAVRNEERHLGRTLEAICSQDMPASDVEVLVLDGASTDRTKEVAERFSGKLPGLRVLDNPGRLSAAGWNLGLKEARATVVSILSGHVVLERHHLRAMLEALNADRAGVGAKAIPVGDDPRSMLIALAFSSVLGNGGASFMADKAEGAVETIAFGVYWRHLLLEAGGFDENIVRGQDWDLNLRLRQRGLTLWYLPQLKVSYFTRSDFPALWRRQYLAGLWKRYIHEKSSAPFLPRHWLPSLFVLGMVITAVAAMRWESARWVFALGALLHCSASIWQGRKLGLNWAQLPWFWWALWLIHTAYGTGMIAGFLSKQAAPPPRNGP